MASLGESPAALEPLLAGVLAALEERLGRPAEETLDGWRELDALRDRSVSWSATGAAPGDGDGATRSGLARGIDEQGRLVVEAPDGRPVILQAADVHLVTDH